MQSLAFQSGLIDIPYNFLIGDDGAVYDGKGFSYQGDVMTSLGYSDDVGIVFAFVGSFNDRNLSIDQQALFNEFIENSILMNKIDKDFKLILLNDVLPLNPNADGILTFLKSKPNFFSCEISLKIFF